MAVEANVEDETGEACKPPGGVEVGPGAAGLPVKAGKAIKVPVMVNWGGMAVWEARVGIDCAKVELAWEGLVGGKDVGGIETAVFVGKITGVTTVGGGAVGTV